MASWLATALGLAGGAALALAAAQALLPRLIRRARDPRLALRLAFAGTLVALAPAILLSIVAGGMLGALWDRHAGTAVGTALVLALMLLAGAAAGVVLARWRSSG